MLKQHLGNLIKYRFPTASYYSGFEVKPRNLQDTQVPLVVKNLPANTGAIKEVGSIRGLGRSPGGGHGSPLQYSWLENPMDRGAWSATVHVVAKSQTQWK